MILADGIVRVFPNPTSNGIHVRLLMGEMDRLMVVDIRGNVLINDEFDVCSRNFVSTEMLMNGIYYLTCYRNSNQLGSVKFVVAR